MSGGVDSSVAALLMQNRGYNCMGVTMRLFDNNEENLPHEKSCCSLNDVEDARSVAYKLGMPYYVFNFTDDFKTYVIDRFVSAYENGHTPNPCIDCNRYMKFNKLYSRALMLECDTVVTGHYARINKENGRYVLKKAVDRSKDQSYVLYFMNQEQLAHTQFPLGEFVKSDIRKIAQDNGFINSQKRDSQDICFVPHGKYADIIEKYAGKKYPEGDFTDIGGKVLGRHKGIINYTIGQRKGLGLSLAEPMFVCEKRVDNNTVILGEHKDLFSRNITAANFNWLAFENPPEKLRLKAKIRYTHEEQWANISVGPSSVDILFDVPQRAITKGQSVVLYDDDTVVGGGTIS